MNMGELFAGIGGFSLGFRRAGFDVRWQVEIDPYCRKVLQKNFPEAERFEDVRTVGAANLQPVDVICGGFPCQDISYAGLGAGIDGERSGLWREYARIIGELRPRFAVVENVPALLARGLGRVLGDLAEIGYDAEWEVISAADAGAPHLRERVWVVAYPSSADAGCWADELESAKPADRLSSQFLSHSCGRSGTAEPWNHNAVMAHACSGRRGGAGSREVEQPGGAAIVCGSEDMADAGSEGLSQRKLLSRISADASRADAREATVLGCAIPAAPRDLLNGCRGTRDRRAKSANGDWWLTEPNVGRVAHGIPSRVDRLRALGNAVVPQIPEWIANRILQAGATA